MANPTSNFNWQMPTSSDLVTDLPADFETFGQAVDTSLADLKGGTTGQVLSKASNTDMDFTWVAQDDSNAIQNAIVDAKGDLIAASAADTPARLAVGTNGQVLTADSTASTGLAWATPATGGGMTLLSTTTLSSTTVTISTISQDYKDLLLILRGATANGGSFGYRTNGITTSNYYGYTEKIGSGLAYTTAWTNGATEMKFADVVVADANNAGYLKIYDYANAAAVFKINEALIWGDDNDKAQKLTYVNRGTGTNGISSITIFSPSGGTIAGTALLYGVK